MADTIAKLEEQITVLQDSVRTLCELAVCTEEFGKMTGAAAVKWLVDRGYDKKEAGQLIASVIRGRIIKRAPTSDEE